MYTMDFAYDGPIFLVPLSPSYPSSPVYLIKSFVAAIRKFSIMEMCISPLEIHDLMPNKMYICINKIPLPLSC